eukprot:TRINITY_DN2993_c0_g1_i6.p1 TRINITY_DN2993_c0_g1~~TRINITY_DN2993_c0_g1_i6.p1  ORF type:complete len:497 (+),score=-8.87 TRINITY_DN2993_c0_g1_i6:157-1647(+)
MLIAGFLALACVKLLYLPSYKSTDFEVHRNWLAITSSLGVQSWYHEATSQWTLDYPPFFAWFEFALSKVAVHFDPEMLVIKNLGYSSDKTILFQRLSVIVTDFVFAVGAWTCMKNMHNLKSVQARGPSRDAAIYTLLLTNAGLFMVDHIHFQYNGFLFGFLLLSIGAMMQEQYLLGSLWFCVLLNLKHIYMYIAPAYFIFLLRAYCFNNSAFSITRLVKLGSLVILTFVVSFGPFVNQIPQVISRLFPFKRGLCHAYWAPNFWAVYNLVDKALTIIGKKFGGDMIKIPTATDLNGTQASMTGGLVQDIEHIVLPSVPPLATFIITFLFMVPCLIKLWRRPNSVNFMRSLTLCGWSSFLFGWHVHEKAVLIMILPMTLLAVISRKEAKYFLLLAITGHFSLFPLLYPHQELYTKMFLHIAWAFLAVKMLKKVHKCDLLTLAEKIYLLASVIIFIYSEFIHFYLPPNLAKYEFLPLLAYSAYSALGVISTYVSPDRKR